MRRGELVLDVRGDLPAGPGAQHAFDAAAALPFLDEIEEAGALERAQVVVQALARQAHFRGELGRGGGLAQAFEQAAAQRRQRGPQRLGTLEQGDGGGGHRETIHLTILFVKSSRGRRSGTGCRISGNSSRDLSDSPVYPRAALLH